VRIVIVTESFLPSANGVTTSVLRVLDHLSARGHNALVVCPGPAPSSYAGFPVVTVPAMTWLGFRTGLPSPALVRAIEDFSPDVLHAASPFGLGAQALIVARRRGLPTVAVFQTDVAGFARKHGLSATAPTIWRWLRHVHSYADVTLAPSSASLADLARNGVERCAWGGRGVDAVAYHPRHRRTAEGLTVRAGFLEGAEPGTVLVGYVGRLAPEKRVERLARLAQVPGVRLVVVGDGPSRAGLETLLGSAGAGRGGPGAGGAVFTGRLDGPVLARAYAALDVFVHTGTHETFGQTLQEAMASGVPVVAPASGGPLDVVAAGETGFLYAPEDDSAMERAVRALVADAGLRARMGEAGRRQVLPRSWQALGDALVGHYESVIAARVGAGAV